MHDSMQYDPIQGQGHKPLKVGNPVIFKSYLLHHLQCEMANDQSSVPLFFRKCCHTLFSILLVLEGCGVSLFGSQRIEKG